MNSLKRTGRIAGALFLISAVTGIFGIFLKGLPLAFEESPKFLRNIFDNSFQINLSIICDILANCLLVGLAVLLFPILKKLSPPIALWYFGFGIISFSIIVMGDISIMSLVSLSQEYVGQGPHDTVTFQALAISKQDQYFGAHFMSLVVYGISAFPFYYIFYRSKLIPRLFSVWGLVAAALVFGATCLQIFGQPVSLFFYLPNGLLFVCLGIWLLIIGFNSKDIASSNQQH